MQGDFFKGLKEYWFVILFIAGIVVGWTQIQSRIQNLEGRFDKLELKVDSTTASLAAVSLSVGKIEVTTDFIKTNLLSR